MLELEEDLETEPMDQARALLAEVVRLGRIDVGRFPESSSVRANLARSLFNAGQLADAEEEARLAIRLDHRDLIAWSLLGYVLAGQHRLEEARDAFEGALAIKSRDVDALQGLADVAMRQKRFDQAGEIWQTLDTLLVSSPAPPYYLGLLALKSEDGASKAIAYLKAAVRRSLRWAPAYQALGAAYSVKGLPERAATAFRTATRLDPTMSESVHGLATALLQGQHREAALAELEKGVVLHPHDYRLRELLALVHVQEERFHQARTQLYAALQELREAGPEKAIDAGRLTNNLGVCYVRTKDWLEADQAFVRSIEFAPSTQAIPANNLGLLRMNRGDYPGARVVLRALEEAGQADEDTHLIIAESFSREDRWRDVVGEYRLCIDAGRAGWKSYANLGASLTDSAKNPEEAVRVLRDAMSLFPDSELIRNNLAYAALMAGDVSAARSVLTDPDTVASTDVGGILLTATNGLLAVMEGELDGGARLYDEAGRLATANGNIALARDIRQKKHLELARALRKTGDLTRAAQEVRAGLSVIGRKSYRADLEELAHQIGVPVQVGESRGIRRLRAKSR